ncbi:MAG: hypothetical protein HS107_01445 [Thermoflexaceae bacterium]|nr:hypothetical protein [Thermoflexaceae bacterium]
MAAVLCLDFDDAVLSNDITAAILERFAGLEAGSPLPGTEAERIHTLRAAVSRIEAPRADLVAFVREKACVRDGFVDLVRWCNEHGWAPMVVTHAFDLAVGAVLRDPGLDRVAVHAGRMRFAYRWRLTYLSPRGVEVQDGFQLSYVAAMRQAGDFVAMVCGPATSPEAATAASVAFVPPPRPSPGRHAREWRDFTDIVAFLEGDARRETEEDTTAG